MKRKFILNLKQLTMDESFSPITRLLAFKLIEDNYLVVGEYIQSLSDDSLENLLEEQNRTDEHSYDNLMLMAEMLAIGEGCDVSSTVDEFKDRLEQFIVYLNMESLARKGLVRIYYENMSFHEDSHDKKLAEKL